jgi:hypothetical protein
MRELPKCEQVWLIEYTKNMKATKDKQHNQKGNTLPYQMVGGWN